MLGEHQSVVPNFTYYPTPNPNPNSSSSPHPNSQTTDSAAYEHAGGVMSVTTNVSPVAGNFGLMTQPMMKIIQPVHCEICNIICNTGDMLEKHKQGKKHLKNLQKVADSSGITPQIPPPSDANAPTLGELENKKLMLLKNGASVNTLISCDLCNVICNNQDGFRAHVAGKKHCTKAANTNGLLDPILASQNKPDNTYQCEICKISCTSNELLNMHLVGKKHQKKVKESEQIPLASLVTPSAKPLENPEATESKTVISQEGKPMSCELCGISCTSYEVLRTHISGKKHQRNLEKSEKPIGPNPAAPVIEPAPEVTPLVLGSQEQDSVKEEGKIVNVTGSKKKTKRGGNHEDVETKKQKILEGGGMVDAMRTCTACNIVCSSPTVYTSHLAGSKHAAMALKQAEAQSQATGEET